MRIPFYQVDAFTDRVFAGNPAGVCLLEAWPDNALLQSIAFENNLSETAFLVPRGSDHEITWFTPTTEVKLCGHATLASAHVLFQHRQWPGDTLTLHTRAVGELRVRRVDGGLELDFPARPATPAPIPEGLEAALGASPLEVAWSAEDLLVRLADAETVRGLDPDVGALARLPARGVIVTAEGPAQPATGLPVCDFVSRFFAPRVGIAEDPVTGSAHCVLIPYWAQRLGKTSLSARQLSARGGSLRCVHAGSRVMIGGRAVTYLEGTLIL